MSRQYLVIRDIDEYVPQGVIYTLVAGTQTYRPDRPGLPAIDALWITDPVYAEYFEPIGGEIE